MVRDTSKPSVWRNVTHTVYLLLQDNTWVERNSGSKFFVQAICHWTEVSVSLICLVEKLCHDIYSSWANRKTLNYGQFWTVMKQSQQSRKVLPSIFHICNFPPHPLLSFRSLWNKFGIKSWQLVISQGIPQVWQRQNKSAVPNFTQNSTQFGIRTWFNTSPVSFSMQTQKIAQKEHTWIKLEKTPYWLD